MDGTYLTPRFEHHTSQSKVVQVEPWKNPPQQSSSETILLGAMGLGTVSCSFYAYSVLQNSKRPLQTSDMAVVATIVTVMLVTLSKLWWDCPERQLNSCFEDRQHEDAAIYLRPKDYVDEFSATEHTIEQLEKIHRAKHSIYVINSENDDVVAEKLEQIRGLGKKIRLLWACGHGSPTYFTHSLSMRTISLLESDASILLHGCELGGSVSKKLNIAEQVTLKAGPLRKVYTTSDTTHPNCVEVTNAAMREFRFNSYYQWSGVSRNVTVQPNYETCRKLEAVYS